MTTTTTPELSLPPGIIRRGYMARDEYGEICACWCASPPERPERQPGSARWGALWGADDNPEAGERSALLWLVRMRHTQGKRSTMKRKPYIEISDEHEPDSELRVGRWRGLAAVLASLTPEELDAVWALDCPKLARLFFARKQEALAPLP